MYNTFTPEDAKRIHFCDMPCFSWDTNKKQLGGGESGDGIIHDHVRTWQLGEDFTLADLVAQNKDKHIIILKKYDRPSDDMIKLIEADGTQLCFPHDEDGVLFVYNAEMRLVVNDFGRVRVALMD